MTKHIIKGFKKILNINCNIFNQLYGWKKISDDTVKIRFSFFKDMRSKKKV